VPRRIYIEDEGFSHLLGFVSYPKKDKTGIFWQENYIGREGVEKQYDALLSGTPGKKLIETNALQKITSENTIESGSDGQNITLSIDSRIQKELFLQIKTLSEKAGFVGGAGVIMDVRTGEILALSSYPEYSSNLITNNPRDEKVSAYFTRKDTPMINRVFGGLYTPGSTVKPFMALSALEENIITPSVSILSTGSISLPNKYGGPATIFRDWKVHGYVNMKEALAASSDVYFYAIGGGYGTQKGLGIDTIDNYMKLYGFASTTGIDLPGEKTGIIPTPGWKIKNFSAKDSVWNIGDTYHTSIGQFGFQLTLLELVRAVAALANGGTLLTPHVLLDPQKESLQKIKIPVSPENIKIINEGMHLCVTSDARGTCKTLRTPGMEVTGKSGTAQLGLKNEWVNSWMTGFFPYENPK
jgi:penicillin-binding protein 2